MPTKKTTKNVTTKKTSKPKAVKAKSTRMPDATEAEKKKDFMVYEGGKMGMSADEFYVNIIKKFGLMIVPCHCDGSYSNCTGYQLEQKKLKTE